MQTSTSHVIENKFIEEAKTLLEQKMFEDFDRVKRIVFSLNILALKLPAADQYRQPIFKKLIKALESNSCSYLEQILEFLKLQIKNISEEVIQNIHAEALLARCYSLIENNLVEETTVLLQLLNRKKPDTMHENMQQRLKLILKLHLANEYLQASLDFQHNYHQQAAERYQEIINSAIKSDDVDLIKLRMLSRIKRIMVFDFAKLYSFKKLPGIVDNEEYEKARAEEHAQALRLDKNFNLNLFDIFHRRIMNIECNTTSFYKPKNDDSILPPQYVYRYAEKFNQLLEKFELIGEESKNINPAIEDCLRLCKACHLIWEKEPTIHFVSAVLKLMLKRQDPLKQQAEVREDLAHYESLTKNDLSNQFISVLAALEEKTISQENIIPLIRNLTKFFVKQNEENVLHHQNLNFVRYVFFRKIFQLSSRLLAKRTTDAIPEWPSDENYNKLLIHFLKLGAELKTENPQVSVLLLSIVLWAGKLGLLDERIFIKELLNCHAITSSYFFEQTVLALGCHDLLLAEFYLPLVIDKLFVHFHLFSQYSKGQKSKKAEFKTLMGPATAETIRNIISKMDGHKNYNADFNLHFLQFNTMVIDFLVRQCMVVCEEKYKQNPSEAEIHYRNLLPFCKEVASSKLRAEIERKLEQLAQFKIAKPVTDPGLIFAQISGAFDRNVMDEAESNYLQLAGIIKCVILNKKHASMDKLISMLGDLTNLLLNNQLSHAEKQLKEYFFHFNYCNFTQSGRDTLLSVLKLYYEAKLMSHAGKLRHLGFDKEIVLACYQKISLPELKTIAKEKIEKLFAPDEVKIIPIPSGEIKEVEKKSKPRLNKKTSPRIRFRHTPVDVIVPEETEEKAEELKQDNAGQLPEETPLPDDVQILLQKLKNNALAGRAYVVGGFVGELANPVGKKTDIDFVFGAEPRTQEEKTDPKFALHLLQKTYPDAKIEEKDKRFFKVIFPALAGKKPVCIDVWWSAPLSNRALSEAEALKVDTYGGEWAADQKNLKDRLTREDIEETPGRDFTANAIYINADGKPFDPTNRGFTDLIRNPSRLKCIIPIEKSFGKDCVRTLRAIHFAAKRNSKISDEMIAKIRALTINRFHEEKPYRVNIILKKLLTQGEALNNFELLRATGLLEKIYPDFAHFLNENKHPLVTKFIYNSLKAMDDLYFNALSQENKPSLTEPVWPSLNRIYLIWIRATELMRKCHSSIAEETYTNVKFDSPVIENAIRNNPFFYEQFMQLGALLNIKLMKELNQIQEQKDETTLRRLINEEVLEAKRLEIQKQLSNPHNKEEKQKIKVTDNIEKDVAVEQKRIDGLDFSGLVQVRNEQIVIMLERFRNKHRSNVNSVRLDWEKNFKHKTEINAHGHNRVLVTEMYRDRLFKRLEFQESYICDIKADSLHNQSLVINRQNK